jgi:hypothetical protein
MDINQIITGFSEQFTKLGIDSVNIVPNLIIALGIIIAGIFIGKLFKWIFKRILINMFKLGNLIKPELIETFLSIIKWIIYIIFIQIAIVVLNIPLLSQYLGNALSEIKNLIEAVVILMVGYGISSYIKQKLDKMGSESWSTLGNLLFVFIIFVSIYLSLDSAISDKDIVKYVTIIISAVASSIIGWNYRGFLNKTGKKSR